MHIFEAPLIHFDDIPVPKAELPALQKIKPSRKISIKKEKNLDLCKELLETRNRCSWLEERYYHLLMKRECMMFELSEMKKKTEKNEKIIGELVDAVSRLQNNMDEAKKEWENRAPRCPVCLKPYDRKVAPKIGFCGHSVCERCVVFLSERNCPICRTPGSFLHPKKNFLAAEFTNNFLFPCNETQNEERITVTSEEEEGEINLIDLDGWAENVEYSAEEVIEEWASDAWNEWEEDALDVL